jgi:putative oxidoreductase
MKIAVIVVRSLMGALFIFASIAYFSGMITPPEQTGNLKIFNDGLNASGYMMPLVKVIELIAGVALISGFFVPLASIILAPVIVNIFLVHALLDPSGLPVGIFLVIANGFLGYTYRKSFSPLLQPKED